MGAGEVRRATPPGPPEPSDPLPDDETDDGRRTRLILLLGVALLLLLTALQVLPAPDRWGSHVAPNDGDPVLVTWILEHQARALLDDPAALYRGNIFSPEPAAIAWSDNLTAFVPPFLLVWVASGRDAVLAYNAVTFLAFAGASLAVLLLARRLLHSPEAAVVAAAAFSLSMVRRSAIGHTQLAGFLFLPLALALLMDVLDRRRLGTAVAAGACLAGLWYTAIYFFVLAVVVVPALVLVWAVSHRHEVDRRLLVVLGATALTTALLVAPSLPPYLELQEGTSFQRSDADLLSIGPASFTRPPSPVYRALGQADGTTEGTDGFVGWTVVALAVAALVAAAADNLRRRGRTAPAPAGALAADSPARGSETAADSPARGSRTAAEGPARGSETATACDAAARLRRRFGPPLAVACVLAAVLSLGPDDGPLSLPYRALRPLVPGLDSARVLSRFWILPTVGLALLAGRGLERVAAGRRRGARTATAVTVGALLVAELFVRPGFSEVDDGPDLAAVNLALAELEPGVVTELPVPTLPDYPYVLAIRQLRSLEDGLPRVEGYSGDAPPGLAEYLQATSTFPSPTAVAALRQAGVRHVVLHGADDACVSRYGPDELAAAVAEATASPAVESVHRVGRSAIVTLVPEPRGGPLTSISPVPPTARTDAACDRR